MKAAARAWNIARSAISSGGAGRDVEGVIAVKSEQRILHMNRAAGESLRLVQSRGWAPGLGGCALPSHPGSSATMRAGRTPRDAAPAGTLQDRAIELMPRR